MSTPTIRKIAGLRRTRRFGARPSRETDRVAGLATGLIPPNSPLVALGGDWLVSKPIACVVVRLIELGGALVFVVHTLRTTSPDVGFVYTAVAIAALCWLTMIVAISRRWAVATVLPVMATVSGLADPLHPQMAVFVGVAAASAASAFDLFRAALVISPALIGFLIVAGGRGSLPTGLIGLIGIAFFGMVLGGGRRQIMLRGRQAAAAERRAAEALNKAVLADERNRLGRELHDVLGHTLGAVSIQVTALEARLVVGDPPAVVRERVGAIQDLVTRGLEEAREAVLALRDGGVRLDERLGYLCELHGATFSTEGEARAVEPTTTLALYRVAQESLTNAEKHATDASLAVQLAFRPGAVSIRVDSGRADATALSPLAASGAGQGIRGMTERVSVIGGTVTAGPSDVGWRVEAVVPCP